VSRGRFATNHEPRWHSCKTWCITWKIGAQSVDIIIWVILSFQAAAWGGSHCITATLYITPPGGIGGGFANNELG